VKLRDEVQKATSDSKADNSDIETLKLKLREWATQKAKEMIALNLIVRRPFPNGVYLGDVNDKGQRHGKGLLWSWDEHSKSMYYGDWKEDSRCGKGVRYNQGSGELYEGEWDNNQFHGQGVLTFSRGDRYVGTFQHSQFCGNGTFQWANGDRYEGNWKGGQMNGRGHFQESNGNVYVGYFEKGIAYRS